MNDPLPERTLGDHVAAFVIRSINKLMRSRDAVYLDTNAWSCLIKGTISAAPFATWLQENGKHLWLARFQVAELAADTRLARPLAELVQKLNVIFLDRGQFEFAGAPWYKVETELELPLRMTPAGLEEFVRQMQDPVLMSARAQLRLDAAAFETNLFGTLQALGIDTTHRWRDFADDLERWVQARCKPDGLPLQSDYVRDVDRYIGLKLSFGLLFVRYVVNKQRWKVSDYIDYLHSADMAYAGTVVTERNLAECLHQLKARPELRCPDTVHTLDWLANPS